MRRRVCIPFAFFLYFFLCGDVHSKVTDIVTVNVVGVAVLSQNEAETKKDALEDAFKKAVAKVVEALLPEEILESDSGFIEWRIYSKANAYIINYIITSKPKITLSDTGESIYMLSIEAKIDITPLKADLLNAGVLREDDRVFKVILAILDVTDYEEFSNLKTRIEDLDMVKGISYVSFNRGRFILLADITGSARFLRERLLEELAGEFEIAMIGQNTLTLKNIVSNAKPLEIEE